MEGSSSRLKRVLIVDDVMTTGRTIELVANSLVGLNCEVAAAFVLINRAGAEKTASLSKKLAIPVRSLFSSKEFNIIYENEK
jgi:orotate phosphoribosyltransferase